MSRRLSRERELELDAEYAVHGEICAVCRRPITRWCQAGTGWSSGFYEECIKCGDSRFRPAHNYCVPWPLRDDGWLHQLVRCLSPRYKGYHRLRDGCEKCAAAEDEGVTIMGADIDVLCPCGALVGVYAEAGVVGRVFGKCSVCGQEFRGAFAVVYVDKET